MIARTPVAVSVALFALVLAAAAKAQDIVLNDPDALLMEKGEYDPAADGNAPFVAVTTGSTVTGATSHGLRKAMFSLFSTVEDDEDSAALTINMIQTSHVEGLARTGLDCRSFTEPDDGGDVSCILSVSTGGGPAGAFYLYPPLRANSEWEDYSTTSEQPALEVATAAARPALLAISGVTFEGQTPYRAPAIRVRVDNEESDGIAIMPNSDELAAFDSRLALYVGNWQMDSAPVNTTYALALNGQATINPSSTLAPFVLGVNAQGQQVTGLAADLLDGAHASSTSGPSQIPIANGSGKLAAGWLSEVLALSDLSDVTGKTGSGTVVAMQSSPAFTGTPTAPAISLTGDNAVSIQRGSGSQGRASGIVLKDQAGTAVGAVGTEGAVTNDLMLMSTADIDFHTNSNLLSTGKVLTVKTNSHVVSAGTAPSVSCTGTGTSPSSPTATGTDVAFVVTMSTGTGSPGSSGTCTVTFASAYASSPPMVCMLASGSSAWGNGATIQETTTSASAPVFTWTNFAGGTLTSLATSTNYKFSCLAVGV